jgi:drug/metabolite transporter (DMT)-like permease
LLHIFSIGRLKNLCIAVAAISPLVLARQIGRLYNEPAGMLVLSGYAAALVGGPLLVVWVPSFCEGRGQRRIAEAVSVVVWLALLAFGVAFIGFVVWLFTR